MSLSDSIPLSLSHVIAVGIGPCSGIAAIEWVIGTEPGTSDVGYGNVPVQNINEVRR